MRRIRASVIGIDQGTEDLFSDFATGGDMWTGSGPRERRKPVTFSEPYRQPPVVQVAVSLWDVDHGANLRADLLAENVTEQGFDLVFRTWSDTRVARARMTWLAIGEIGSDDDWQV
ncbi:H-type lectin domain-containing protein [Salipiger marinus]|jgi:hypothetical protein|uniref:H-type lectin domain-containing protein n=1 Tax=Salipiger marinus TaxID=555512 RepID=UPI000E970444|nr:H-type lectin domain-containing protein [Salipiger manganoxidans]MCD1617142.1 H-type lectin domain-containing protein [Salipiger manganoxidans]MEB3417190.1 H-type lectin domain-containing protein [Salipiger manganoxidans]HBM60972.1 hypothetical protein [Citreicella sp.]|tara:strand:- start:239 stop:586 length:348 start_codon:yes stop_codon:yes gene_type:complete